MSLKEAVLKEPLIYFLLLAGALIALEKSLLDEDDQVARIQVSAEDIQRMEQRWNRIYFRSPTDQELNKLIQQHVREEVFYREAKKMDLDKDDSAIRNRLYQKLAFLAEGLIEQQLPSDEQLHQYFLNNQGRFLQPERYSIQVKKLNGEWLGKQDEQQRLAIAEKMEMEPNSVMITASMVPGSLQSLTVREIEQRLGSSAIAHIINAPEERWIGPVPLQGGEYVLKVTEKHQARAPKFEQVKEQLLHEFLYQQRQQAEETLYQRLKSNYQVSMGTALP